MNRRTFLKAVPALGVLGITSSGLTDEVNDVNSATNVGSQILPADIKDKLLINLKPDDIISYHWGMLCQKISLNQAKLLNYYTNLSLTTANKYKTYDE